MKIRVKRIKFLEQISLHQLQSSQTEKKIKPVKFDIEISSLI